MRPSPLGPGAGVAGAVVAGAIEIGLIDPVVGGSGLAETRGEVSRWLLFGVWKLIAVGKIALEGGNGGFDLGAFLLDLGDELGDA